MTTARCLVRGVVDRGPGRGPGRATRGRATAEVAAEVLVYTGGGFGFDRASALNPRGPKVACWCDWEI